MTRFLLVAAAITIGISVCGVDHADASPGKLKLVKKKIMWAQMWKPIWHPDGKWFLIRSGVSKFQKVSADGKKIGKPFVAVKGNKKLATYERAGFSPNGRMVALHVYDYDAMRPVLWLWDLAKSSATKISIPGKKAYAPEWLASGAKILVTVKDSGAGTPYLYDVGTGKANQLCPNMKMSSARPHPTQARFGIIRSGGPLSLAGAKCGGIVPVMPPTNAAKFLLDGHFDFSPNGLRIAVRRGKSLWIAQEGKKPILVTNKDLFYWAPLWLDDSTLLFLKSRKEVSKTTTYRPTVWSYSLTTGKTRRVTRPRRGCSDYYTGRPRKGGVVAIAHKCDNSKRAKWTIGFVRR